MTPTKGEADALRKECKRLRVYNAELGQAVGVSRNLIDSFKCRRGINENKYQRIKDCLDFLRTLKNPVEADIWLTELGIRKRSSVTDTVNRHVRELIEEENKILEPALQAERERQAERRRPTYTRDDTVKLTRAEEKSRMLGNICLQYELDPAELRMIGDMKNHGDLDKIKLLYDWSIPMRYLKNYK